MLAIPAPLPAPCPSFLLSRHAARRAAQRSLPQGLIGWLLDLGERVPAGGGAELARFGRRARALLAAELGRSGYADVERKLATAYAILAADGTVVTLGHRTRRLPRA